MDEYRSLKKYEVELAVRDIQANLRQMKKLMKADAEPETYSLSERMDMIRVLVNLEMAVSKTRMLISEGGKWEDLQMCRNYNLGEL